MSDTVPKDYPELVTKLKNYPSFLNLEFAELIPGRLKLLQNTLQRECQSRDACDEEIIYKLNMQTWILLKLHKIEKASEVNERVLAETKRQNIVSIANCVLLSWELGDELNTKKCLKELDSLKNIQAQLYQAEAEQAYCYVRMGSPSDLYKAIKKFEDVLESDPSNFLWKLRLGVGYRRVARLDLYTAINEDFTIVSCLTRAFHLLQDVSQNCQDSILRGPAFAELAVMCLDACELIPSHEYQKLFGGFTPQSFCNEALKSLDNHPWTLATCGRTLRESDVGQEIQLLKKSADMRPNSTVFHHLGMCYSDRAKESGLDQADTLHYFKSAERAYLEAIKLSHNRNLPALYDLGLLHSETGDFQLALRYFNKITNECPATRKDNLQTKILAYEQAGLCYFKIPGEENQGEGKLLKAISMSARLASGSPELRIFATQMWACFRVLENRLDAENSLAKHKKLISLCSLVRDHRRILKVIEEMLSYREDILDDTTVITNALESYLNLGRCEESLAFLNMVSTRSGLSNSVEWNSPEIFNLKTKVLLKAAHGRLQKGSGDAAFVFQQLFQLCFCHEGSGKVSSEKQSFLGDVILIYDDSEGQSSRVSRCTDSLQQTFRILFGLDTTQNLQDTCEYGDQTELQLQQLAEYRVVVVVLGEKQMDSIFEEMLKRLPIAVDSSLDTVLVLDAGKNIRSDGVPKLLKQYRYAILQDFVSNINWRDDGGVMQTEMDVILGCFHGNTDAVMKLFCFIVGIEWQEADP